MRSVYLVTVMRLLFLTILLRFVIQYSTTYVLKKFDYSEFFFVILLKVHIYTQIVDLFTLYKNIFKIFF